MSGHPIYYLWQGRAPQLPSLPTHSFNPWQAAAAPPLPVVGAPLRARQRFSRAVGGRQGSGGRRAPRGEGGGAGSPPPGLAPAPGGARRSGPAPGRRRPLLSRAAAGSPRLQVLGSARPGTARELPHSGRQKAGLPPPARGRSQRWAQGSRPFPASGHTRCSLPGSAVPPRSSLDNLHSRVTFGK